jgi:hypothetical protein
VNDFGKRLFTATTFACDEHTQIGRSHSGSYFYGKVEFGAIAYNAKPLFYAK